MSESSSISRRNLRDDDFFSSISSIQFKVEPSDRFYGRESEFNKLEEIVRDTKLHKSPHCLSILGYSGVGKTALVSKFVKQQGDGVVCLQGKFEARSTDTDPFPPLPLLLEGTVDVCCQNPRQGEKARINLSND